MKSGEGKMELQGRVKDGGEGRERWRKGCGKDGGEGRRKKRYRKYILLGSVLET